MHRRTIGTYANEDTFYIRILFLPSLLLNIPVDRPSFAQQKTCSCAKFLIEAEGVPKLESEDEGRSTFTECPKDSSRQSDTMCRRILWSSRCFKHGGVSVHVVAVSLMYLFGVTFASLETSDSDMWATIHVDDDDASTKFARLLLSDFLRYNVSWRVLP